MEWQTKAQSFEYMLQVFMSSIQFSLIYGSAVRVIKTHYWHNKKRPRLPDGACKTYCYWAAVKSTPFPIQFALRFGHLVSSKYGCRVSKNDLGSIKNCVSSSSLPSSPLQLKSLLYCETLKQCPVSSVGNVSLMPLRSSPVAEVHFLLPFRELPFTYLAELKEFTIRGLTKDN